MFIFDRTCKRGPNSAPSSLTLLELSLKTVYIFIYIHTRPSKAVRAIEYSEFPDFILQSYVFLLIVSSTSLHGRLSKQLHLPKEMIIRKTHHFGCSLSGPIMSSSNVRKDREGTFFLYHKQRLC